MHNKRVMFSQTFLPQGSFWGLQRRIREGNGAQLGVVTCCELGLHVDRLIHPALPLWILQNDGANCQAVEASLQPLPADLVILSHHRCRFLGSASVEEHLERQTQDLLQSVRVGAAIRSNGLKIHPWCLNSTGDLQVYLMEEARLVSPFNLPSR